MVLQPVAQLAWHTAWYGTKTSCMAVSPVISIMHTSHEETWIADFCLMRLGVNSKILCLHHQAQ